MISMECYGLKTTSQLLRNKLILSAEFVDSQVDVTLFVEYYPNVRKLTFVNSVVTNCPVVTKIEFDGGCSEKGKTDINPDPTPRSEG